jgi:hypothetical protein
MRANLKCAKSQEAGCEPIGSAGSHSSLAGDSDLQQRLGALGAGGAKALSCEPLAADG